MRCTTEERNPPPSLLKSTKILQACLKKQKYVLHVVLYNVPFKYATVSTRLILEGTPILRQWYGRDIGEKFKS
jgi:hypothetical protein